MTLFLFIGAVGVRAFGSDANLIKNIDKARSENRLSDALKESKELFTAKPDDYGSLVRWVRSHNDIGESLLDQNKKKEAEPYFREADKYARLLETKFPKRAEVQYYRAVVAGNLDGYLSLGKQMKMGHAVEKFAKRAVELDSNFQPAYVVLGSFYREIAALNSFERAVFGKVPGASFQNSEKLLRKAIELNPNDPFAHFELAGTLSKEHKSKEAKANYQKVLSLPQSDPRQPHLAALAKKALEKK